jgi:cell division septal protein FtsQ
MRINNNKNQHNKFKKATAKKTSFQIIAKKITFFFLLILFLGVAGWVFFFSDYTRIHKVEVKVASEDLNRNKIKSKTEDFLKKKKFNFLSRENILNLSGRELEGFLKEEFLRIKEVEVRKVFPHKISLDVQGRESVAIWQRGDGYFLVDNEGLVFRQLSQSDVQEKDSFRELILIKEDIFSKKLSENERDRNLGKIVDFSCQAKKEIEQALDLNIKKEMQTPSGVSGEIRLATEDGWKIMLNTEKAVDSQIALLRDLLKKDKITEEDKNHLEYIDLRISGKAIYKSSVEIDDEENEEEKQSDKPEKEQFDNRGEEEE